MNSERMLLKAKAMQFFSESGIAKDIETSLNSLFKEGPKDHHGFISTFFERLSSPAVVSCVEAVMVTGDSGLPAMKVTVYGSFKNEEMVLSQISPPNNVLITPCVPLSLNYIKSHSDDISRCITLINEQLNTLMLGLDPRDSEKIHKILRSDGDSKQTQYEEENKDVSESESKKEEMKNKVESAKKSTLKKGHTIIVAPDDPAEILCPLLGAHSAVSMAMAMAASKIERKSMREYTIELTEMEHSEHASTLPMVALLRNGKGLPGKCQLIKRCFLIPNGLYDTADIVARDIRLLSFTLFSNLQSKTPMIMTTEHGELVPAFDRADQFLDVIQEVIKECGLEEKMRIVVEIGARGIFDMDKGKYEVMVGQMKSSEEVVTMLIDLVDRYNFIVGLLDPLRTRDKDAWKSLGISVNSHCWVMGQSPRVQKVVEPPFEDIIDESFESKLEESIMNTTDKPSKDISGNLSSVMCFSIDGQSLYRDYITYTKKKSVQMICAWLYDLSAEDWLVDLTCGLQVSLLALPGLRCFSGATKLNHWTNLTLTGSSKVYVGLSFPEICNTLESAVEPEDVSFEAKRS